VGNKRKTCSWFSSIWQYEEAVRIKPDFAEAHYNLAGALSRAPGRTQEALAQLDAGLRLQPNPHALQLRDQLRAAKK
jgi:tetratricopeptide (TPR) repeat protein